MQVGFTTSIYQITRIANRFHVTLRSLKTIFFWEEEIIFLVIKMVDSCFMLHPG